MHRLKLNQIENQKFFLELTYYLNAHEIDRIIAFSEVFTIGTTNAVFSYILSLNTKLYFRISLPNNNLVHTVRLLPPVASPIRPRAPIATSVASQIRPLVPPVSPVINIRPVVATAVPSTQSVRGRPPKVAASIEVKKISPCSELPLGSRIQALKTGTKIVSNNIRYSTQSKTGDISYRYTNDGLLKKFDLSNKSIVVLHGKGFS